MCCTLCDEAPDETTMTVPCAHSAWLVMTCVTKWHAQCACCMQCDDPYSRAPWIVCACFSVQGEACGGKWRRRHIQQVRRPGADVCRRGARGSFACVQILQRNTILFHLSFLAYFENFLLLLNSRCQMLHSVCHLISCCLKKKMFSVLCVLRVALPLIHFDECMPTTSCGRSVRDSQEP